MSKDTRNREQQLLDFLKGEQDDLPRKLDSYINRFHKVDRGWILSWISILYECRALKASFIDHDQTAMRQQFYMTSILSAAANAAGFNPDFRDLGLPVEAFVHALLSDSPECINQIAHAGLMYKADPKSYHYYTHMLQLLLLGDHSAIKEMIAVGAKKCGKPLREEFATGRDFFSLFLRQDKPALEEHIFNLTKIKSELIHRDFLHYWAVLCTKLCWIKGIEVEIDHPLIPMALMPVKPLPHYEIEYDFLRSGWEPPKDDLLHKIKRWLK
ncbi:Imm49 family immunity protein [Iodobacter sp.]|uniref:Imm49 family immunity protein n=1 Tax=Iodobacter sp. TaxID=1915058 RepID=UPI0025FEC26B|nr:Imm49 family immunity protein [Iodobacter sp.]